MPEIPDGVRDVLARLGAAALIDIVIISLSIYWLLLLIRGTAAMTVLRGAGVLLVAAFLLSGVLDLQVLNWILRNSVAGLVIAIALVFQGELRRALEGGGIPGCAGHHRVDGRGDGRGLRGARRGVADLERPRGAGAGRAAPGATVAPAVCP